MLFNLAIIGTNAKTVSLGELCLEEPCYGTSATAIERNDDTQPKYIRISDFDDFGIEDGHKFMAAESYTNKHLLQPNDILFARTGGTVGKTYFYDGKIGKAVFAGYCIRFRFDESKVLPKFVYWYTKTDIYRKWVDGIQRPSGQPNINKEEYKSFEIILPTIDKQEKLIKFIEEKWQYCQHEYSNANQQINLSRQKLLDALAIDFPEYKPSLYSCSILKNIRGIGIYCNPHSDYLSTIFSILRENKHYVGNLEKYVEVNPSTNKVGMQDEMSVSFVPMTAVEEKINKVSYEIKPYKEVKTGFTNFQKDDLLWAKITPCMQNGKSFIASNMPTQIGFASTEFHVLRKIDERIYMPFLWVLLSDPHILEAAQGMFSGSAGQQRVSDAFLKKFPIILPSPDIQKELADNVFNALELNKSIRQKTEQEWQSAKKLFEKELLGD